MQRNEWLSLIFTLIIIVLWVEARESVTGEPVLACAPDAAGGTLVSRVSGASPRRCGHDAPGPVFQASSDYPAGRRP